MMFLPKTARMALILTVGIASVSLLPTARSQESDPPPPEKARALLDQVKQAEIDRQMAVKQKEIDRLVEDQARTQRDTGGLQKTIESTSTLLSDSEENLRKIAEDSRRMEHELKVNVARAI